MHITFYTYPRCSTCRKAKKWLEQRGYSLTEIHLVEQTPTAETLRDIQRRANVDIKKLFNTNGKVYRELGLKDRLATMTDDEKFELLSSNGMLIKRPIAVANETVTIGFKEAEYEEAWQ